MGRGTPVKDGQTLVPYNTKLKPETKATLDALAKVLRLDGQRELIEKLLAFYGQHFPKDIEHAESYQAVLNPIDPISDPIARK